MLTWMTAGESHGPALVAVIDGVPSGLELTTADLERALARRRLGYGRGARQAFERDEVRILSGVRHGRTIGSPIAVEIANSEWPKWRTVMAADPVDPAELLIDAGTGDEREIARNRPLTRPRPGHADLAGMLSYDLPEARPVLERASARETAARVALGAIAEALLAQAGGIELVAHVVAVGPLRAEGELPRPQDAEALDGARMRALDPLTDQAFVDLVDEAKAQGDTIGGVVEVVAWGVPVGLGSHVAAARRLDAAIAQAVMSIQSVKGVEIGDGFAQAALLGSQAHDEILKGADGRLHRASNRAGGIEGGTSNGEAIVVRAAFKPISTVPRALRSVDLATGEEARGLHQRSDTCQLVPGALIVQAELALVLADALFAHAGGNSVSEMKRNLTAYLERVAERA
ncbi:MAG: chorismate synthase [Schaalia hyovaginalis]|uniref:chorismate synthase n=2 Tax=Schaalia hyovaginalis TaxID=29316 RepID=UPI0023F6F165|nr:chorismate synthase [Schaalia hyovaginalis]MCI7672047.1 chorismate synthase [Schaalia hyovaginalis]MDY6213290.1 chorismate synthase [Schaalia hyovaginalis]